MNNQLGQIEISSKAIATFVSHVVLQTYGVVGMSTATTASHIAAALTRDPRKGVEVAFDRGANSVTIDVYVILRYGINLASVANSLIDAVRYHVATRAALEVAQVNVHIQGLRVSKTD